MPSQVGSSPVVSLAEFEEATQHVSRHAYHTPLLTSRLLSERTGFDIRLKAEMFQKGGSYKVRGPLNKFRHLTAEQRRRRDLLFSRESRAGRRHCGRRLQDEGGRGDGQQCHTVQGRRDTRLWCRGRATRHNLGRSQREGQTAL